MNENKLPLTPKDDDIKLILAAKCYIGTRNINEKMKKYMYTRRDDGIFLIHIGKLWEKLILAARVLVTVEDPKDIYITSSSLNGRRPANKLSEFIGASCNLGRFTPGTFTRSISEPQILVCLDPSTDYQALSESSQCNIPVIAFTNSHTPLKFVDIAIPCNNMGYQSIGVMCWLLARAVLRLRGKVSYIEKWSVIPDMFFHTEEIQDEADKDNIIQEATDSWSGHGPAFSSNDNDNGDANWQNDNPKVNGGGWDQNNENTDFNFETTEVTGFGSSDISAFDGKKSMFDIDSDKPVESWADDVPKTEKNEWDTTDTTDIADQQWNPNTSWKT